MPEPSSAAPRAFFSPGQRRMIASALSLLAFLTIVWLLVRTFTVLVETIGHFSGVLWPLATAGILALMLQPLVDLLTKRLQLRRLSAVIILYGAFVLLLAAMMFAIIPPLVAQLIDFVTFLPELWTRVSVYVENHYPQWVEQAKVPLSNPMIRERLAHMATEAQALLTHAVPSLKSAGVGLLNLFAFVTSLAIIPIYLFFFLLSSRRDPMGNLGQHLPFLSTSIRDDVVFLAREFVAIVVSFFRGQLLIGLLMGVLLAIGFTVVGLRFGLFIGLALGILNIVPYLGTIIGLSIALPLAFFQPGGSWSTVGLVVLVFVIVQNIEGWFLTPKIMGDRTGLHPVVIIIAIFFWGTALNGILGMILAIPLTAFFVTAWRLAKRKYFRPVV